MGGRKEKGGRGGNAGEGGREADSRRGKAPRRANWQGEGERGEAPGVASAGGVRAATGDERELVQSCRKAAVKEGGRLALLSSLVLAPRAQGRPRTSSVTRWWLTFLRLSYLGRYERTVLLSCGMAKSLVDCQQKGSPCLALGWTDWDESVTAAPTESGVGGDSGQGDKARRKG